NFRIKNPQYCDIAGAILEGDNTKLNVIGAMPLFPSEQQCDNYKYYNIQDPKPQANNKSNIEQWRNNVSKEIMEIRKKFFGTQNGQAKAELNSLWNSLDAKMHSTKEADITMFLNSLL